MRKWVHRFGPSGAFVLGCVVLAIIIPASRDRSAPGSSSEASKGTKSISASLAAQERIEERQRLARAVLAGDLSLTEAAVRFGQLNAAETPGFRAGLHAAFPGASEEERLCRQVIAFVRAEFRGAPTVARVIACRLERELYEALQGQTFTTPHGAG
jgi:hypothetical protein